MYIKSVVIGLLLLGLIYSQIEMNYSYEMKYGNGKQVKSQASDNPDTTDYSYFENLLDLNNIFSSRNSLGAQ